MNTYKKFCISVLWILFFVGFFACDTARNTEDPDLSYFVKYYGGDGDQYGVDMLALQDGSFLLLGNYGVDAAQNDIYLLRVNAEGDVIWEKRFAEGNHNAKDLEPTNDGNFIILSDFQAEFGDQMDFKLLKVSPDGDILATVVEGHGEANDYSRTVTVLADGGFIVSGTTEFTDTYAIVNSPDPDLGDFFNYRFDANLNLIPENDWNPISPGFGGKLDVAVKTFEIPDETNNAAPHYYIFGFSNSNLTDNNPNRRLGLFYFRRDDGGGATDGIFPGIVEITNDTQINFVETVPPEMGAGFFVVGTSQDQLSVSKIFIAKLRSTLIFDRIGNDVTLFSIIPLGRNIRGVAAASSLSGEYGFLILGNEVRSTTATNIWLSKIDQSGIVLWSTTFGSEAEDDFGAAVTQLPDGKIVILGTMGLADNQFKMAFIKVNPRGEMLK